MEHAVIAQYFGDIATQYARDVVSDAIPACRWTKLACERHLRDLEHAAAGWLYEFNPVITMPDINGEPKPCRPGERICMFAQMMPHVTGDWAGRRELIKLEPWQVFILTSIFGWLNVETGKRRFRVADLFVPRKNAKSTIGAVIGLYMLAADGEFGAEVYSGATTEDQAMKIFGPARAMARTDTGLRPTFCDRWGVTVNVSNLSVAQTNSKFEPIIGNPGDGGSPSCALVDEYHEHKKADLFNTMKTGMGARSQPLLLVLTTAGSDISGPCYGHQIELQKVLEGVRQDERRFGIIYGIDRKMDWTSERALVMANPNFGVSVVVETLRSDQQDAIANPQKQNVFKTKHLNEWVAAASPWLNLHKLQLAGDAELDINDFAGETCWDGLDLASKIDIASRVKLFRRQIEGQSHYYAFSKNYVPQSAVDAPENTHYQGWVLQGHLTATVGNMISLKQIEEELVNDAEKFVVSEVALDAWGAREMAPSLMEQGFTVIDVPMHVRNLSEPMKEIQALIEDGRFHHDDNPAFVWMLSNVDVYPDRNANIFPRKQRTETKIDAAVALILAMGRAMLNTEHGFSLDEFLANPIIV
jgi:phage terminase large subunit-like protein